MSSSAASLSAKRFADGEVELGIQQLSELRLESGITVVGTLLDELQHVSVVSAAVSQKAYNLEAVFPGWQGGPLMHVIAAKVVDFKEAQSRDFRIYQERVLENARVLSVVLEELPDASWRFSRRPSQRKR